MGEGVSVFLCEGMGVFVIASAAAGFEVVTKSGTLDIKIE